MIFLINNSGTSGKMDSCFGNTPIQETTPNHYLFTHKMCPKHPPFFLEESSKASSVDALHIMPKYKSQSIYSIQVDTRLTTFGRIASINLVLVLSLSLSLSHSLTPSLFLCNDVKQFLLISCYFGIGSVSSFFI